MHIHHFSATQTVSPRLLLWYTLTDVLSVVSLILPFFSLTDFHCSIPVHCSVCYCTMLEHIVLNDHFHSDSCYKHWKNLFLHSRLIHRHPYFRVAIFVVCCTFKTHCSFIPPKVDTCHYLN